MSLNLVAMLQMDLGRTRDAAKRTREALALLDSLVKDHPLEHKFQMALAETCGLLAVQEYLHSNLPEAHRSAERTWAICDRLVREHPDSLDYAEQLVTACTNLSVFYRRLNRPAEALRAYEHGQAVLARLMANDPASLRHRLSQASLTGNLSRLQDERGQTEAALAGLTEAIRLEQEIVDQVPSHPQATRLLRSDLVWRAEVLSRAGRHTQADADWQRALQLSSERDANMLRGRRALTRARVGLIPPALTEAEDLIAGARINRATGYDLAAVYALASAAVRRDEKLDAEERTRRAEQHATASIDLLKGLVTSGAFREPAQVERIKKDKDFDAVRERPEFAEFMKQITAKPEPPAKP